MCSTINLSVLIEIFNIRISIINSTILVVKIESKLIQFYLLKSTKIFNSSTA